MLKTLCQHCDTELRPDTRFCDRCGAPSVSSAGRERQARQTYRLYKNLWRGFSLEYPEDWRVDQANSFGVTFNSPGGNAYLEFGVLPPNPALNAPQQAELLARGFPIEEYRILDGATSENARIVFRGKEFEGMASVNFTQEGGTLGLLRHPPGADYDCEGMIRDLLRSVGATQAVPKQTWVDPLEQSFRLTIPQGWQVQSQIKPFPGGSGVRIPAATALADATGQTFFSWDPTHRMFIDGEIPPEEAPADEGFFGMLGRVVKTVEHSFNTAMGEVVCPFKGLKPAVEHFFLPHWQQHLPGCELISVDEFGPNNSAADVRISIPGGLTRVYRLEGAPVPGSDRWVAGHTYYYQAPTEMMPQFEPLFRGVAESQQANPDWNSREQARVAHENAMQQQQFNQMMAANRARRQQENAAFQRTQAAFADCSNTILDGGMAGWQARQSSSDYLQHQWSNGMYETGDFLNADTNTVYNLPIHCDHYWDTNQDHVVGTNFDANTPVGWTKLHEVKGY